MAADLCSDKKHRISFYGRNVSERKNVYRIPSYAQYRMNNGGHRSWNSGRPDCGQQQLSNLEIAIRNLTRITHVRCAHHQPADEAFLYLKSLRMPSIDHFLVNLPARRPPSLEAFPLVGIILLSPSMGSEGSACSVPFLPVDFCEVVCSMTLLSVPMT